MSRGTIRVAALVGGLGLVAELAAAPSLTPPAILLVSAEWLLLAGFLVLTARILIAV